MLFNTSIFLWFFVAFYVIYSFVAVTRSQKLWLIVIASLLFYGSWNYKFVPLLLGTGFVDFFLARRIYLAPNQREKKLLLAFSVGMNLGVLAIFKYTNFFLGSLTGTLELLGVHMVVPTVNIVLPVGISFYTFQSISYTVDVYRGTFAPRKRIHEFLAALTFFPHLVAGPIVRSSFIIPQFEALRAQTWEMAKRGFLLVAVGLFKKTIGDLVGQTADDAFGATEPLSAFDAWSGALAFTVQVYGDFSGYTDIAIGVALLLGFELPENFHLPYVARSPVEFWHRWHISLSTWLRDYLWLPLSVANTRLPFLNLIVTMLLGGLWHGANWTFVAWGLYHGVLLTVNHAVRARLGTAESTSLPIRAAKVLGTLYLVTVGWVLFRATSFTNALAVLRGMHLPKAGLGMNAPNALTLAHIVVALVAVTLADYAAVQREGPWAEGRRRWTLVVAALMFAFLFGGAGRPFIYFQF